MTSFKDMTYCKSDCVNYECPRHSVMEKEDMEKLLHLNVIYTLWFDLSGDCPDYEPPKDAA